MLLYVGSFSYTPRALLCGEFLLHSPCSFMWGVSLTRPVFFYVRSFSCTLRALSCGEFLLHAPCSFMWGVSRTHSSLLLPSTKKKYKKMQEHGQSVEVCIPRLRSSQCRDRMSTLPWFWPDAQHVGDCGHRLLHRHFTMADTARLESPRYRQPADRGSEPTWSVSLHQQS